MAMDLGNTCRICMASGEMVNLVSIFEESTTLGLCGLQISEKLKAINILIPTSNDRLPKSICNSCVNELDQAYLFKEKFINSEVVLLRILEGDTSATNKVNANLGLELSSTEDAPLLAECMIKIEEGCELEVAALNVPKVPKPMTIAEQDQMLNEKFPCLVCYQEFATKKYLNRHILRRHLTGNMPVAEKKDACKTPAQSVPFVFHHRIGCPICGMMFAKRGIYNKHYKTYHLKSKDAPPAKMVRLEFFECHYDGQTFATKKQLRRHMSMFHKAPKQLERSYKCRKRNCEKSFENTEELDRHRNTDHDNKSNSSLKSHIEMSECMIKIEESCELEVAAQDVPKFLKSSITMSVAEKDEMLNVKFPCLLCNQEFATKKYLNRHILRQHLTAKVKVSQKEELWQKHYNIPVPEKKYVCKTPAQPVPFVFHHRMGCPFCGMMFAVRGSYDKHYKTYHLNAKSKTEVCVESEETPPANAGWAGLFECHYDGRTFAVKKQLRRHLNRFHRPRKQPERSYKCRKWNCERRFASVEDLNRHRTTEHDNTQLFTCHICSKSLKTNYSLKAHIEMHSDSKNYLCNECGKAFVTKAILKEHLVRHLPYKLFRCEICGREFSTNGSLTKHRDTHTGMRPYRCEHPGCTAQYTHPATLKRHIRVHTGEKPYQCEFCLKRFRARSHMIVHRRIHTNERPHKCSFAGCGKAFNQKNDMNLHMRVHTGIKPHICPICQMAFRQLSTLKTHIKGVHKNYDQPIVLTHVHNNTNIM